jgi:hypothetical protein
MTGNQRAQQGIILIGLMIVLVIAAGATFLHQANRSQARQQAHDAKTTTTLLTARDALLARAILDRNRPGSLPCPDTNDDGIADLAYPNCTAYAGRLPWRTLDLDDPRDGSGERLWYVLSPAFNDGNTAINATTAATLTLDGQGGMVAMIIAPGGALDGQARPSNDIAAYLDDVTAANSNRDGDNHFFSAPSGSTFNDRIIAIDSTALFSALSMRLLGEIRQALAAAGGALPQADDDNDGLANPSADSGQFPYLEASYDLPSPTWPADRWYSALANNGWFPLITYDRSTATISVSGRTITLP